MNLEIRDFWQSYEGFTLGPLTLKLSEPVIGLIGVNGAGKTTFLTALSGISQTAQGHIYMNGVELRGVQRLASFAFLQHRRIWYDGLTLRTHLRFVRAFYRTWSDETARKLTEHFDLDLDKRVRVASTGTLAKLGLLVALARGASVVLLDEPWNDLDPPSRIELSRFIIKTRSESGPLFIVSSHDLSEIEAVCDRFIMLENGRIISDDTRDKVLTREATVPQLTSKFIKDGHV